MHSDEPIQPPIEKFLDETAVAREYGLGLPGLRKRRRLGLPPKYHRIGRMVRYKRDDIEAFLADCAVEPTAVHGAE